MSNRKSTLNVALNYVERHPTRVLLPIRPDHKFPPLKPYSQASNDPARLTRWHQAAPGCEWAMMHAQSNCLVMDVDPRHGGSETLEILEMLYGPLPQTEENQTPSGGRHVVFEGRHIFALGKHGFGQGIDSPHYTIIPGCELADGGHYRRVNNLAAAAAPSWFYKVLGQPPEHCRPEAVSQEPLIEWDQPANIDWAKDYLVQDAPPSISGKGGEQTTLDVGTVLKDYGISEATALELMAEFYNVQDKCDPIWSMDETPAEDSLPVKVHNAYTYKRNIAPGASAAESEFANDDFEVLPLDKKTAAIVARQKLERAKAKADEANGIRRRKPRRMDKTRRNALKRAAAMATPYRSKSNG
jgi:Bifunctional DNA primase/polymerase, N-terminal